MITKGCFFWYCIILFLGDKTLDGYQKKKYVCKLLFIFLLGNDIDFGHMEAVNLLSSNKYTEKQIVRLFLYYIFTCSFDSSVSVRQNNIYFGPNKHSNSRNVHRRIYSKFDSTLSRVIE